jgi:hypothetical protein
MQLQHGQEQAITRRGCGAIFRRVSQSKRIANADSRSYLSYVLAVEDKLVPLELLYSQVRSCSYYLWLQLYAELLAANTSSSGSTTVTSIIHKVLSHIDLSVTYGVWPNCVLKVY